MRVLSWNVLHLIHELNHNSHTISEEPRIFASPVLNKFYDNKNDIIDEYSRMAQIEKFIIKHLNSETVFALQEVPGILLNRLKTVLKNYHIIHYLYPRVPKMKDGSPDPYGEYGSEYLVTIVSKNLAKDVSFDVIPFDKFKDFGKGALVVKVGDIDIYNYHMEFGQEKRLVDLEQLFLFSTKKLSKHQIMLGDSNMSFQDWITDSARIGFQDNLVELKEPTREGVTKTGKLYYIQIDHISISSQLYAKNWFVENTKSLSDHYLIGAEILVMN